MAINLMSAAGASSPSTNSLTISSSITPVLGKLFVVSINKKNNESVTAPAGWTSIKATYNSTGNVYVASWYKIITQEDVDSPTFNFSWSTNVRASLFTMMFSGFNIFNPISSVVDSSTINNTASPTFTDTSLTPSFDGSVLYLAQSSNDNTALLNASSGKITLASNTIDSILAGSLDNDSTLNKAVYSFTLGSFSATGNISFNGASAGSDWAMHAFLVNAPDPTVLYEFAITTTGDSSIPTQQAGVPFDIKIKALNALGDVVTSFTGTVDITSTGELGSGSGTTPAFTAGILSPYSIRLDNFGSFYISAKKTGGVEMGSSNSFTVGGDLNIQKHKGNIFFPVKILPTLSNVKHINIIMAPITSVSGTQKEAAINFYFNMSPTPTFTKYITRDDIAKGYVSFEINKPYVNSIQVEIEYFNVDNKSPDNDYSNIGVADFCPAYAEVIFERTSTIR